MIQLVTWSIMSIWPIDRLFCMNVKLLKTYTKVKDVHGRRGGASLVGWLLTWMEDLWYTSLPMYKWSLFHLHIYIYIHIVYFFLNFHGFLESECLFQVDPLMLGHYLSPWETTGTCSDRTVMEALAPGMARIFNQNMRILYPLMSQIPVGWLINRGVLRTPLTGNWW